DPQKLIAEVRMPATEKPRQLIEAPVAPDPAVHGNGDERTAAEDNYKQPRADESGRIPETVDPVHQKEGRDDAEDRPADGLRHLDRPDLPAEIMKLILQVLGQMQPFTRLDEAHDYLQ